jgi:hypothetical protein
MDQFGNPPSLGQAHYHRGAFNGQEIVVEQGRLTNGRYQYTTNPNTPEERPSTEAEIRAIVGVNPTGHQPPEHGVAVRIGPANGDGMIYAQHEIKIEEGITYADGVRLAVSYGMGRAEVLKGTVISEDPLIIRP